jgi:uncharacterized protein YndB with AHSA1/START domain
MTTSATPDAYGVLIEPSTVKIQRLLPGPIERVWAYLTQSELRRRWLAAGEMEMKVGAPFELAWRSDELTNPPGQRPPGLADRRMQSRIVALDPPLRLVIAWENSGDVSFELEPKGSEVLLTLIHRRLPNRASLLGHSAGWHTHLDVLGARAQGTEPAPFWDGWTRMREEYDQRFPADDEQTPTTSADGELQMEPEGSDSPATDDVETSVFAPPRVAPRAAFLVQAHLHVRSDTSRVFRKAHELDKSANRLAFRSLTKRIARGATVELCLDCPSLLIDEPYRTVTWNGAAEQVSFQVEEAGKSSTIEAVLYVSVGGIPVGDIAFTLQVSDTARPAADRAPAQATRYEQAFISYSRRDFDKVSLFAQGLAASNIKPCVDVTHLEPGHEWEHKLPQHIAGSDVFYLMWSDHAANSPWVERESREAVKLYETSDPKRPRIVPITLHRPAPEPPEFLRQFHFDSPWLAQRAAQSVPLFRTETGGADR